MFGPKTPQEKKFYECEIELDCVQSFRLAKLTILQSKCPLWRKERLKRITSSRKAHELLRAWENYQEGKVDAAKFLEIFRFVIKGKIKALDHGNDTEADAKKKTASHWRRGLKSREETPKKGIRQINCLIGSLCCIAALSSVNRT